jgi:hypothetical protein
MVGVGLVGGSSARREDRAEEQPRAEFAGDEIGVLALPAEAGGGGQRLLHHRRGVDEHLHLAPLRGKPARRRSFSRPLMIRRDSRGAGIDRDRAAVRLRQQLRADHRRGP